ncbi:MAG: hypothetical protein IFK94_10735 [Acidobacteria bacterium]|uniref:Uncharacterized protein n=1 Tax=Candidatus Polarisedimenticola svalbardensis TaxID=2886004 RepID=A0A8J6Y1D8_9BACT|nr:hypothetical protein [Candidatus Polarisedimenticola svalbardensis]
MGNRILFIHGRSFKPERKVLRELWISAVRHGLARSRPDRLARFDAARKEFVYYGDISGRFLRAKGKTYQAAADVADRRAALAALKDYTSGQFTRARYNRLPGKESLREFFADVAAGPLNWFGLSERAIGMVAPDMLEYWNLDSSFGSDVRWGFTEALRRGLQSGDRLMVVAHSLGTMIAWDTMWKFSYRGEYQPLRNRRVDLFLTLGCPLGDETVKDNLIGSRATGSRRYPANLLRWENVSAADDYISHDQRVSNDYRKMLQYDLPIRSIKDHRIYNLTVRNGESNPHSSAGYLIHPKVSRLIADWL